MTYLIDPHILIWFVENDPKLSRSVRLILEDSANTVLVSHASFWEITIKKSIGKLDVTLLPQALEGVLSRHLIQIMNFKMAHYETLYTLPFYHQDPFDRMLISQAITEDITIVTQDSKFKRYEDLVDVLWNDQYSYNRALESRSTQLSSAASLLTFSRLAPPPARFLLLR